MNSDQDDTDDRGPAREAPRDSLFLLTSLATPEGDSLGKARVRNLSSKGLMADCERAVPAKIRIVAELRGIGKIAGVVAWSRQDRIGIAFDKLIDPQLARMPVGAAKNSLPDYLREPKVHRAGLKTGR